MGSSKYSVVAYTKQRNAIYMHSPEPTKPRNRLVDQSELCAQKVPSGTYAYHSIGKGTRLQRDWSVPDFALSDLTSTTTNHIPEPILEA